MRTALRDSRAVHPAAGSGFMVVAVVLIAAVVGTVAFGITGGLEAPESEFRIDIDDDEVTITHAGGDPIPAEELVVRGDDPTDTVAFGQWPDDGLIEEGDRITLDPAAAETGLEVVWESVAFDRSVVLESHDPEDTGLGDDGWDDEFLSVRSQ